MVDNASAWDATHDRMKRRNPGPWRFFAHAIAMIVLLAGCAYLGVPATSDPYANYAYACALADARRVMPAEDMFRQAIDGFRERGHLGAQAMAMIDYANLITSPAFIGYRLPPGYAPLVKGPLWPSHRLVALGGSEGIDATAHAINLDAAEIAAKALVRVIATT